MHAMVAIQIIYCIKAVVKDCNFGASAGTMGYEDCVCVFVCVCVFLCVRARLYACLCGGAGGCVHAV